MCSWKCLIALCAKALPLIAQDGTHLVAHGIRLCNGTTYDDCLSKSAGGRPSLVKVSQCCCLAGRHQEYIVDGIVVVADWLELHQQQSQAVIDCPALEHYCCLTLPVLHKSLQGRQKLDFCSVVANKQHNRDALLPGRAGASLSLLQGDRHRRLLGPVKQQIENQTWKPAAKQMCSCMPRVWIWIFTGALCDIVLEGKHDHTKIPVLLAPWQDRQSRRQCHNSKSMDAAIRPTKHQWQTRYCATLRYSSGVSWSKMASGVVLLLIYASAGQASCAGKSRP